MLNRRLALPLIALLLFTPLALDVRGQQAADGSQITESAMLADTTAAEPGKPFNVGFHFKIAKGWHTYWHFAGSPGLPLTVEWELPPGWQAGPLEFPLPESVSDQDGNAFFAYEHEVLFPVRVTPPAQAASGGARLVARLKWQVCREQCILGSADMELKLPFGPGKPANGELFAKWLGQLPKTTAPPTDDVKFEAQDKQLVARVGGLPADVKVEFFPVPPESFGSTFELGKKLTSQTGDGGTRVFGFLFDDKIPADLPWRALLVVQKPGGSREGWMIGAPTAPTNPPPKPDATPPALTPDSGGWDPFDDINRHSKSDGSSGLLFLLVQGFFGGLLLNLMPCVLPVISLKIFGFVRQAGESRTRIFHLGLAFCAGVFAFFAIIATLIVAFVSAGKSFGWGAQFSNPLLLTAMLGIVFVFGLSLLGVFEFTLGGGTTSKLSELSAKEGPVGAFLHGLFTTLLGTSCTAPLVGPVIGAAITRPGPQVYALFAAIAIGLALPYFLLTWQPAWMKFLPKPGTWMVRFKQVLGFVMLGLVVWLLDSFPTTEAIVFACAFLLVLGFGCWLMGSYHESRWALPTAILLALGGWYTFVHGKVTAAPAVAAIEATDDGLAWEPFSIARIRQALEQKRPVFVDFTAKWCLNCKYFEATVINTAPVIAAMKAKGVVTIKADYTREPPDIAAALKKTGRAGVPVYVLFRKRGDFWIADGLTQSGLLEQINRL
jgi:thiol:disulfide interchange protein DsbD